MQFLISLIIWYKVCSVAAPPLLWRIGVLLPQLHHRAHRALGLQQVCTKTALDTAISKLLNIK
jgi:hypothetical protein